MNSFYASLWREKISRRGFNWSFLAILSAVLVISGFFVPSANAVVNSIDITYPTASDIYVKGTFNITWTASGDLGELVDIYYSTNNFTDSTKLTVSGIPFDQGSYLWDTIAAGVANAATYKVRVQSITNSGVQGTSVNNFTIDNTAPVTTATYDPANTYGWYTITPTITLNCTDVGGSGCHSIFYKWHDADQFTEVVGNSVIITAPEGDNTLYYYSEDTAVDNSGIHNQETPETLNIKLDTGAPTISISGAPSELIVDKNGVTAEATCEDSTSGCQESKLYISPGIVADCSQIPYADYVASPQIVTDHSYVCAYAKDNAGNEDFSDPVEFTIFGTIQSAIDAATPHDTIQVAAGIYPETLNLQGKPLTIEGAGIDITTVNASSLTGHAIQNFGDSSTIGGLTLIGTSDNYGFKVSHVNDIAFENIKVENSYRTGIDLNTVNNVILNNIEVKDTSWGFGLMILDSNDVTVTDVTTSGNEWGGVTVQTKNAVSNTVVFGGTFSAGDNFPLLLEQDPDASSSYYDITNVQLPIKFGYIVYDFREGDNYKQWYYFETLDDAKTVAQSFVASGDPTYSNVLIYDIAEENYYVEEGMLIQDAVNTAEGTTINVAAGTYDEQLVIDKNLTLQGAGDTTIIQPSGPELLITTSIPWIGGSTGTMSAIVSVETVGGTVNIKNLKIDGSLITSKTTTWQGGLVYLETGGIIDSVTVNGGSTLPDRTAGIFAAAITNTVSLEVTGCTVEVYTRAGIYALGGTMTANYNYNVINGPGPDPITTGVPNGMFFLEGAKGSATYNTVTDLAYAGDPTYKSTGIGTYNAGDDIVFSNNEISYVQNAFALSNSTIGTTVEYNDVHDCHTGVRIESGADESIIQYNDIYDNTYAMRCSNVLGASNEAHYNNFVNNIGIDSELPLYVGSVSMHPDATVTLDAINNWWGASSGPSGQGNGVGDAVSANVDYDPWYIDSAMQNLSSSVSLANIYVDDNYDAGSCDTAGYIWNLNCFATIQEGIDVVASGGTVNVAAGDYDGFKVSARENLIISGVGDPVVSGGTVTVGMDTALIGVENSTGIIIEGLTLDATGIVITPFAAVLYSNSSGTIQDNTIENIGDLGQDAGAIWIQGGDSIAVLDNTINEFNKSGILVKDVLSVQIEGNTISTTNYSIAPNGIQIGYVMDYTATIGTVHNNQVSGCHWSGYNPAISYEGNDNWTGSGILVIAPNSALTISGNEVQNSDVGLDIEAGPSTSIHDNDVYDNSYGFVLWNADPTINLNNISGNNLFGVYRTTAGSSNGILNATNNWWGNITGPAHLTNPKGTGNAVSDNVDFNPFYLDENFENLGSVDPIASLVLAFDPTTAPVLTDVALIVTAKDASDYTVVNDDSTQFSLIADGGASFGSNLITLITDGTADTTITNNDVGIVNVTAEQVGGSVAGTGQVEFTRGDIIPPTIDSHSPVNDTIDISVTVNPTITFSEILAASTVNSSNIQLIKYDDDTAVPIIVLLVEGGKKVLIMPENNLENDVKYYFAVSDVVTDEAGNDLANPITDKSNNFTTIAIEAIVVDDVEAKSSSATADDTYLNGWHYTYKITVNTDETDLYVQFADWVNSENETEIIPANGNMRILFNRETGTGIGTTVGGITEDNIVNGFGDVDSYEIGNAYTDQKLNDISTAVDITDLDTSTADGRQVQFDVFTKIPSGTVAGFYDTTYDIEIINN